MARFNFPLERVLRLRQTQVRIEEAKLDQFLQQIAQIEQRRARLGESVAEEQCRVLAAPSLTGPELAAMEHFRSAVALQANRLAQDRQRLERAAQQQMTIVQERRREARLFERLREQRLAEWQAMQTKDIEQLAAESFLARLVREARADAPTAIESRPGLGSRTPNRWGCPAKPGSPTDPCA